MTLRECWKQCDNFLYVGNPSDVNDPRLECRAVTMTKASNDVEARDYDRTVQC